jgi:succinoglycan biosynthesis transport protein ExoP
MNEQETAGLGDYLALLKRRRYLALVVALAGIGLALVFATALPSIYNAAAEFRVSRTSLNDAQRNNNYVDEYVTHLTRDVMKSQNLLPIVEQFGLYPELADQPGARVARLARDTHVDMVTQKILDQQSGREREIYAGFTVVYDAATPEAAAGVPTALADVMVRVGRDQRAEQAARVAEVFDKQAEDYGERIARLERELAEFKEANYAVLPDAAGLNAASRERTEQEIGSIEQEMRALQQNRIFLQAQLSQAREVGPDTRGLAQLQEEYRRKGQSYDANHPDMVQLRRQIDALSSGRRASGGSLQEQLQNERATLAEIRQRYSEDHPDVRRQQRAIATLEARIAAGETTDSSAVVDNSSAAVVQLQTQLNANAAQMNSLAARAAELRGRLGSLDARMRSTPEVEREYASLVRNLELEREKYSDLLRRAMDARGEQASILAGARDAFDLVRTPQVPGSPAKPRRAAILVIGVLASIILALGAALLAELFDGTVRGRRDIIDVLGITPLAVVPEINTSSIQAQRMRRLTTTAAIFIAALPILYFIVRSTAS